MIQWFPGHMAKTRKLMQENLKLVDVVIEMMDARLPLSSRNPLIDDLVGEKPRLVVMAKSDLAEAELTQAWIRYFQKLGWIALAGQFKGAPPAQLKKQIAEAIVRAGDKVLERRRSRGIVNQSLRVMVTGIPNVGKSTLINLFAGKAQAEIGDRPGVTRGKQWIRLDNNLELLDMPGILWPRIEDPDVAKKLATTGAIGENAYDPATLCLWLIPWLVDHRPGRLEGRYQVKESLEIDAEELGDQPRGAATIALMEAIGRRRGLIRKGQIVELDKVAVMILDELRAGRLGPLTFETPPQEEADHE